MKKPQKPYFPMFVDLSGKRIVVIGAGVIASRRIHTLLAFTDHLVVIAPKIASELLELESRGLLSICKKPYDREDIYDADIVIAATDDPQINNDIYSVCKCIGITVNVCNDKNKCDFYFPGIVRKENLVIGVSTSGTDYEATKHMTQKIRNFIS